MNIMDESSRVGFVLSDEQLIQWVHPQDNIRLTRFFLNFPLSSLPFTSLRPYFPLSFRPSSPFPYCPFLFLSSFPCFPFRSPPFLTPFFRLFFLEVMTPALTRNWTLRTHRRTPALTRNWTLRFRAGFLVPKNGKEPRFVRSGWLLSSEERKEPSFVRPFGFGVSGGASEFRRTKKKPRFVSIYESWFASSEERKRTKIRSGGLPIFGKSGTKIRKIGWISEFRRTENQDSIGWIFEFRSTEKNQDSIGWIFEFRSTEKNQDSFRVDFQRSEEKEPRFFQVGFQVPENGKRSRFVGLGGFPTNG
ncbi:unnamed protein product [Rhizophagus irregularis]|nr:unnamed protein product [Rhizophagus irregularis]